MSRILITGAAGFIGSTLADRLLSLGETVIAVDDFSPCHTADLKRANVAAAVAHPGYMLCEADIRDRQAMIEIFAREKPGVVVHLAACAGIAGSLSDPEKYYSVNVLGTQSVLEACRVAGVAGLVFSSSWTVYGESTEPVREDSPLPPVKNTYVATKLLGEATARAYADICGLKVTVLRLFSVYGRRQREETAVLKFMRLIQEGLPVPVYGDGSACRNYINVEDCVDGMVNAIQRPFDYEIINLAGQRSTTLTELIAMISAYLGRKALVRHEPVPEALPASIYADNEKACRLLGYTPRMPLEEGLSCFVQWYEQEKASERKIVDG